MPRTALNTNDRVARLPHTRLGWTITRLRARLHSLRLDEALGAGTDPWTDPLLLVRATQLCELRSRRALAAAIIDIVAMVETRSPLSPRVRLRRYEIFHEREALHDLAAAVHSDAPVPLSVLARLTVLVNDGGGPLYVGGASAGHLADTVRECASTLHASPAAGGP